MNTQNYGWALPDLGASRNVWGTILNTLLGNVDAQAGQIWKSSVLSAPANNYAKTTNYIQYEGESGSGLTGIVAGRDGEIVIIESILGFTDAPQSIIKNLSSSSSNGNKFAGIPGGDIVLYSGDRIMFQYDSAYAGVGAWIFKEIFRRANEVDGDLTGITWVASVDPTVDSATYVTYFTQNHCYIYFRVENSAGGTAVTEFSCDLPPSVPVGNASHLLYSFPFTGTVFTNIASANSLAFSYGSQDDTSINVRFPSGVCNDIAGVIVMPLIGQLGF